MYVCICNGYRDSELRELAAMGVACAIEAYHTLGSGPCCGRCVPVAQQIIDETLGATPGVSANDSPVRPAFAPLAVAAE